MVTVRFHTDPATFVEAADAHLAAAPVVSTVITRTAGRAAGAGRPPGAEYYWFATLHDRDGLVIGLAMRTAPFRPYPLWINPMPEAAAVELARALHARGEFPGGANGALPAARTFAEESARLWGGRVEVAMGTRLHELGELSAPDGVLGRARLATYDDTERCRGWFNDFDRAAREQAGNGGAHAQGPTEHGPEEIRERIAQQRIMLWEDPVGEVVHLTGFGRPEYGVAGIGPVYTPAEHRGHGYAGATVAEVSRRLQDAGVRVCLFTDLANPVSNQLYERLGFHPVVDMANHTVVG